MKHENEKQDKCQDVRTVIKENEDLRRAFEKLERRCEEEREKCMMLLDSISQKGDASEISQRCNGVMDAVS